MAVKRYRTKPVEIEAVKFTNSVESFIEVRDFCGRSYKDEDIHPYTFRVLPCLAGRLGVPEGAMQDPGIFIAEDTDYVRYQVWDFLQATWVEVNDGDYIIKGVKGEFYPCDPETFAWKYEEATYRDYSKVTLEELMGEEPRLRCDFDCGYCHIDEEE